MSVNLAIDRTTIVHGPCFLTYNTQTIYSKDDVKITPKKATWDVPTSVGGKKSGKNLKDMMFVVELTPDGEVTAGLLAVMCLYASQQIGSSIFNSGLPLSIASLNDATDNFVVMRNASITKLPDLHLATDKTLFGPMEFTCVGANGVAVNDPNRFCYINTKPLSGTITGTTNANPDVITTATAHGLAVGDPINLAGVLGDTAVNGNFYALATPSPTTFTISATTGNGAVAIAGNGAYTGGGTWGYGWPLNLANVIATPFVGQWATSVPSGNITATNDGTPDIVTTATAHNLAVTDRVVIAGDTGDTAINGTWFVVSVPSPTTFEVSATRGGAAIAGAGTAGAGGTYARANALDSFDTESGMQITFNIELTPKKTNNLGTYDMLFSAIEVKAKGLPVSANGGPSTRDIINSLNVQNTTVQMGQSLLPEAQDLYLAGNGIYFRLYAAAVEINEVLYSSEKLRPSDFGWTAIRRFGSGANLLRPMYAISTTPINS
jgi:hypothetical protein